jgi:hypothetical protein
MPTHIPLLTCLPSFRPISCFHRRR